MLIIFSGPSLSQPMHDKVCPLRGAQHAHERSVENLLSVPSTPTLANTAQRLGVKNKVFVQQWATRFEQEGDMGLIPKRTSASQLQPDVPSIFDDTTN